MSGELKKEDIIPVEIIQKSFENMASIVNCHIELKKLGYGKIVPEIISLLSLQLSQTEQCSQ